MGLVEERKNFLRWLSEINFDEDHDKIYSKRHPETGKWLIKENKFQKWVDHDASAVLWCFGKRMLLVELIFMLRLC